MLIRGKYENAVNLCLCLIFQRIFDSKYTVWHNVDFTINYRSLGKRLLSIFICYLPAGSKALFHVKQRE